MRILALLLAAAACGSFPHPSEEYACERDRDCAGGRICRSGWCVTGGRPCDIINCDDLEDCTVDSCQGGECRNEPMADGTPCGGAGSCVSAAVCQAGTCLGEPEAPGTPCDDTFYCTEADTCDGSGGCVGSPRDCGSSADACSVGTCNEEADSCEDVVAEDYTSCSDNEVCTANDVCHGGSCSGAPACECDSSCETCNGGCCDVNYIGSDCGGGGCRTDCTTADCACYYGCATSRCEGDCTSDCTVLCSASSECDLACAGDSQCNLRCTGANRCRIDCSESAHCLIDCGGLGDACEPGDCADGWSDCGGGVSVCNRPCP